jgi:hypothetical protein
VVCLDGVNLSKLIFSFMSKPLLILCLSNNLFLFEWMSVC